MPFIIISQSLIIYHKPNSFNIEIYVIDNIKNIKDVIKGYKSLV